MKPIKKPFRPFQIRWKEPLGNPECPYAFRWAIIFSGFSIRLHHWIGDDDDRAFHDHPWWFITFMLKGGYTDVSPVESPTDELGRLMIDSGAYGEMIDWVKQFQWRFRPAEWKHRVVLGQNKEAWTLLLTGPKIRKFGFYIPGRKEMMRPLRFFDRFGHHPCED